MNTVLIILGVLGVGAIAVSAYVFVVAARNYVSNGRRTPGGRDLAFHVVRSDADRRQSSPGDEFPIVVNGVVVEEDRRVRPERRALAS